MADEELEAQDPRGFEPTTPQANDTVTSFVQPVARGLSTALMQGAFESFGKAFTQTGDVARDAASEGRRMDPWRQAGQKSASALELRWHTMEYENFQAQIVEPYMAAKKQMMGQYMQMHADLDSGVKMGPDGVPQNVDVSTPGGREEMIRLRGQLEKDFYSRNSDMDIDLFHYANKYSNNPLVSERIKRISESTSNQLMTVTNPAGTLAAEGAQADITAKMMGADTANLQAKANLNNVGKTLKEPTGLRQVRNHPDIGADGSMEWLIGSEEGQAYVFGNRGGDSMRDAANHYEAALIKKTPSLKDDPEALQRAMAQMQGRIRQLAAATILKEQAPDMYKAAKLATPWFFEFEKAGTKVDGILGDKDARGYTGDRRMSIERKKEFFTRWEEGWQTELDDWASKPGNELTPENAMEHMTEWVKDAITNGADGVPNEYTIAINANTKALREELVAALLSSGGRNLMKNHYMAEANPGAGILETITHPFGGQSKRRSGRRYRGLRPGKNKKGILGE